MASCSDPANAATPYFPPDLIPKIARRLTSLQDFFALRASCRAYRAVLPLTRSNLVSQAPLLLLVPHEDRATESPALFHLTLRRLLRFRLPRPRQDSTSYFSLGCRVLICDYLSEPKRRELRMVHLLTGEQTRLPSPLYGFSHVVLSGDLLLTYGYFGTTIQFCRLAAADWCVASIRGSYNLEGMICVNGTIYVLVSSYLWESPVYDLAVVELSDNRSSVELVFLGALDARALHLPVETELSLNPAECRGELILIVAVEYNPSVYHAFSWKSEEAKWVRITSLGECALFFACNYFVGCLGPDHPGIGKDCIYFNEEGLWSVYSSVDGSFRKSDAFNPGGILQEAFMPSVWVFPSMC